ncbi:MAG: hypothetical protein NC095_07165 [Muribaculum sp.]|nr:hypothetical protein [Muribaculum sp.]
MEFAFLFCNFANLKTNANRTMMEENFGTRLKLFMDSIGVQSSQFADSCEIPRPSFSQLLSGRNQKVSDILIKKIHAAYPDLSIMWLMFGEGSMKSSSRNQDESPKSANPVLPRDYSQKNSFEASENPTDAPTCNRYQNLKALNPTENTVKDSIYQQLEDNKKIVELQMQIDKIQKNPRRVTQITVYYDDSTFETFIPSK